MGIDRCTETKPHGPHRAQYGPFGVKDCPGVAQPAAPTPEVRKIGYLMQVRVVDGVPQCPCCQEPMVQRGEGWMCAIGAAGLDMLADAITRLDKLTTTEEVGRA